MKLFENFLFFALVLILHLILLYLFTNEFYILYFLGLAVSLYTISKYYKYFSSFIFLFCLIPIISLVNLDFYDEFIFEFYLKFNMLSSVTYINDELIYILATLHTIVLVNLNKFDYFWDIMEVK